MLVNDIMSAINFVQTFLFFWSQRICVHGRRYGVSVGLKISDSEGNWTALSLNIDIGTLCAVCVEIRFGNFFVDWNTKIVGMFLAIICSLWVFEILWLCLKSLFSRNINMESRNVFSWFRLESNIIWEFFFKLLLLPCCSLLVITYLQARPILNCEINRFMCWWSTLLSILCYNSLPIILILNIFLSRFFFLWLNWFLISLFNLFIHDFLIFWWKLFLFFFLFFFPFFYLQIRIL